MIGKPCLKRRGYRLPDTRRLIPRVERDTLLRPNHARGDDVRRADVDTEPTNQCLHESAALHRDISRPSEVALQGPVIFMGIAFLPLAET